jgi:putative PIN family toxin of toxin-antitoxin system
VRAVLDANVLISALLSPSGAPAPLLLAWQGGHFELIVSGTLLGELKRALAYPKLRTRIPVNDASEFIGLLSDQATMAVDPPRHPSLRASDPDSDYLLALAAAESAMLVSGDAHLLALSADLPIRSPAEFLRELGS